MRIIMMSLIMLMGANTIGAVSSLDIVNDTNSDAVITAPHPGYRTISGRSFKRLSVEAKGEAIDRYFDRQRAKQIKRLRTRQWALILLNTFILHLLGLTDWMVGAIALAPLTTTATVEVHHPLWHRWIPATDHNDNKWSPEQIVILNRFCEDLENDDARVRLCIEAVAGSGKTTVLRGIMQCCAMAYEEGVLTKRPEWDISITATAFNGSSADVLNTEMDAVKPDTADWMKGGSSGTLNAHGLATIKKWADHPVSSPNDSKYLPICGIVWADMLADPTLYEDWEKNILVSEKGNQRIMASWFAGRRILKAITLKAMGYGLFLPDADDDSERWIDFIKQNRASLGLGDAPFGDLILNHLPQAVQRVIAIGMDLLEHPNLTVKPCDGAIVWIGDYRNGRLVAVNTLNDAQLDAQGAIVLPTTSESKATGDNGSIRRYTTTGQYAHNRIVVKTPFIGRGHFMGLNRALAGGFKGSDMPKMAYKNQGGDVDPMWDVRPPNSGEAWIRTIRDNPKVIDHFIELVLKATDGEVDMTLAFEDTTQEATVVAQARLAHMDCIYAPAWFNIPAWRQFDLIIADEVQDMSELQGLLLQRLMKADGNAIIVGDRRQSIYLFSGASSTSMDGNSEAFECTALPMTVCWRQTVALANEVSQVMGSLDGERTLYADHKSPIDFIPDWPQGNPSRVIHTDAMVDELEAGNMVLCRVGAPLVKKAIGCLKRGIPARLAGGGDLESGLRSLWSNNLRMNEAGRNLHDLSTVIESHLHDPKKGLLARLTKRHKMDETAARADDDYTKVVDLCEALVALVSQYPSVVDKYGDATCAGFCSPSGQNDFLSNLFVDPNADGEHFVMFSTVHRAKGLERKKVFIMCDRMTADEDGKEKASPCFMLPFSMNTDAETEQERNAIYIAITRAMKEQVYCTYQPGAETIRDALWMLDTEGLNLGWPIEDDGDSGDDDEMIPCEHCGIPRTTFDFSNIECECQSVDDESSNEDEPQAEADEPSALECDDCCRAVPESDDPKDYTEAKGEGWLFVGDSAWCPKCCGRNSSNDSDEPVVVEDDARVFDTMEEWQAHQHQIGMDSAIAFNEAAEAAVSDANDSVVNEATNEADEPQDEPEQPLNRYAGIRAVGDDEIRYYSCRIITTDGQEAKAWLKGMSDEVPEPYPVGSWCNGYTIRNHYGIFAIDMDGCPEEVLEAVEQYEADEVVDEVADEVAENEPSVDEIQALIDETIVVLNENEDRIKALKADDEPQDEHSTVFTIQPFDCEACLENRQGEDYCMTHEVCTDCCGGDGRIICSAMIEDEPQDEQPKKRTRKSMAQRLIDLEDAMLSPAIMATDTPGIATITTVADEMGCSVSTVKRVLDFMIDDDEVLTSVEYADLFKPIDAWHIISFNHRTSGLRIRVSCERSETGRFKKGALILFTIHGDEDTDSGDDDTDSPSDDKPQDEPVVDDEPPIEDDEDNDLPKHEYPLSLVANAHLENAEIIQTWDETTNLLHARSYLASVARYILDPNEQNIGYSDVETLTIYCDGEIRAHWSKADVLRGMNRSPTGETIHDTAFTSGYRHALNLALNLTGYRDGVSGVLRDDTDDDDYNANMMFPPVYPVAGDDGRLVWGPGPVDEVKDAEDTTVVDAPTTKTVALTQEEIRAIIARDDGIEAAEDAEDEPVIEDADLVVADGFDEPYTCADCGVVLNTDLPAIIGQDNYCVKHFDERISVVDDEPPVVDDENAPVGDVPVVQPMPAIYSGGRQEETYGQQMIDARIRLLLGYKYELAHDIDHDALNEIWLEHQSHSTGKIKFTRTIQGTRFVDCFDGRGVCHQHKTRGWIRSDYFNQEYASGYTDDEPDTWVNYLFGGMGITRTYTLNKNQQAAWLELHPERDENDEPIYGCYAGYVPYVPDVEVDDDPHGQVIVSDILINPTDEEVEGEYEIINGQRFIKGWDCDCEGKEHPECKALIGWTKTESGWVVDDEDEPITRGNWPVCNCLERGLHGDLATVQKRIEDGTIRADYTACGAGGHVNNHHIFTADCDIESRVNSINADHPDYVRGISDETLDEDDDEDEPIIITQQALDALLRVSFKDDPTVFFNEDIKYGLPANEAIHSAVYINKQHTLMFHTNGYTGEAMRDRTDVITTCMENDTGSPFKAAFLRTGPTQGIKAMFKSKSFPVVKYEDGWLNTKIYVDDGSSSGKVRYERTSRMFDPKDVALPSNWGEGEESVRICTIPASELKKVLKEAIAMREWVDDGNTTEWQNTPFNLYKTKDGIWVKHGFAGQAGFPAVMVLGTILSEVYLKHLMKCLIGKESIEVQCYTNGIFNQRPMIFKGNGWEILIAPCAIDEDDEAAGCKMVSLLLDEQMGIPDWGLGEIPPIPDEEE